MLEKLVVPLATTSGRVSATLIAYANVVAKESGSCCIVAGSANSDSDRSC